MIVSLFVCITVLILAYRAEPFINRLILIKERTLDAQITEQASGSGAVGKKFEIPDDLEAFIMAESETWAQEDARAIVREKFVELKDWNKVRLAVGIGEMP